MLVITTQDYETFLRLTKLDKHAQVFARELTGQQFNSYIVVNPGLALHFIQTNKPEVWDDDFPQTLYLEPKLSKMETF